MIHDTFDIHLPCYCCINLTFKMAYFWAVMPDCDAQGEGDGREEASIALGLSQTYTFVLTF